MRRIMDKLWESHPKIQIGKWICAMLNLREQVPPSTAPDPASANAGQTSEPEDLATLIRRYRAYMLVP